MQKELDIHNNRYLLLAVSDIVHLPRFHNVPSRWFRWKICILSVWLLQLDFAVEGNLSAHPLTETDQSRSSLSCFHRSIGN